MAVTVVACLVVAGPALFTRNGFGLDFTNHLWLSWVQQQAISAHGAPTYFVSASPVGIDYPVFIFYGGSLYALTGALGALFFGHIIVAFVAVCTIAVAAAYGGMLWLARQLGARTWAAHAPAITFCASAYYVTNLYARGAWPEFVATSMVPLLLASGWWLMRAARLRAGPCILFVVACVVFSGSHNITLLLGTLTILAFAILLRLALAGEPMPSAHRLAQIAGLALLGLAANAWFLLPDLVNAGRTRISAVRFAWSASGDFNAAALMFDPFRRAPASSTTPALYVQAPVWLLAWALTAAGVLWTGARPALRRTTVAVAVVLGGLLLAIMDGAVWNAVPTIIRDVQVPYRLNTYVALCVAGLVLVWVLTLESSARRRRTALGAALAGALGVSVALCLWQLWAADNRNPRSYHDRGNALVSTAVAPRTWYDVDSYDDRSQPITSTGGRVLIVAPGRVRSDDVTLSVAAPPGRAPFAMDLAAGPYAVRVGGDLVRDGRAPHGAAVLRRVGPGAGPATLTLATAGGVITAGRGISLIAVAVMLLALIATAVRSARRRTVRAA